jgi:hypothetical protein
MIGGYFTFSYSHILYKLVSYFDKNIYLTVLTQTKSLSRSKYTTANKSKGFVCELKFTVTFRINCDL